MIESAAVQFTCAQVVSYLASARSCSQIALAGQPLLSKLLAASSSEEFRAAPCNLGVSLERQTLVYLPLTTQTTGKEAAGIFNFISKRAPSSAPLSHLTFSID